MVTFCNTGIIAVPDVSYMHYSWQRWNAEVSLFVYP